MKKLLLCTAIAASLGLYGCGGGEDLSEVEAQTTVVKPFARMVFNPPGTLPLPNDAAMLPATSLFDFTIESENQANYNPGNPLDAVGALDGWSTQYPFTLDVDLPANLTIDASSLNSPTAIRIFEATQAIEGTSAACQAILAQVVAPGIPCEVGNELVRGVDFITTLSDSDTIAVIPMKQFKPNQGYMLVVTQDLKDSDGRGILGSTTWDLAIQDIDTLPLATPAQLQLQGLANLLVGAAAGAGIPVENNSYTAYFSTVSAGTVTGTVKSLQVGPFAQALGALVGQGVDVATAQAQAAQFLPVILVNEDQGIDTAFDFVSQLLLTDEQRAGLAAVNITNCASMVPVLTDPTSPLYPTVLGTFQSLGAYCAASVKSGQVNLPYYLDPEDPLTGRWLSACTSGVAVEALGGTESSPVKDIIDASAFGPNNDLCQAASGGALYDLDLTSLGINDRRHLTKVAPIPKTQGSNPDGTETIDVQVTIPDENMLALIAAATGTEPKTKPEAGWPVVVIQHGITSRKEFNLLATGVLSVAGFATVSIDHPLHGSRGFNIDGRSVNASGGLGGSTTDYLNLSSLLTARDNLRQSMVDTMGLRLGLNAWVDLTGNADIDASNVHFLGQSLGSITGIGTVATANTPMTGQLEAFNSLFAFNTAAFSVPGGGMGTFLVESAGFGPLVSASVLAGGSTSFQTALGTYAATNGVPIADALIPAYLEYLGTRSSTEAAVDNAIIGQFSFAAQTVVDSGDAANYAVRAAATTPILLHEVVGGGTNDDGSEALPDQVIPNTTSLPTSGTEPLIANMGLQSIVSTTGLDSDTPIRGAVRFTSGSHSSLFSPASSFATTVEMQTQVASFFASNGTTVVVTDDTVVKN